MWILLLKAPFAKKILAGLARTGLAALGGYLVKEGVLDRADIAEFVAYLTPIVAAAAWSVLQKRHAEREVQVAQMLPSDTPRGVIAELAATKPKGA